MSDFAATTLTIYKGNEEQRMVSKEEGGQGGREFDKMDPRLFEVSVCI